MKPKKSAWGQITETLSLVLVIGTVVYLIVMWRSIPDTIPAHYNAAGEVNRWGDKSELIFLPIIGGMLYFLITLVQQYPQAWNTGVAVTEQNRERVYRILGNLIGTTKLMMLLVFSSLTVLSSLGLALPIWYMAVFLVLLFGAISFFLVQLSKERQK
ncbi:MAG TPA: DUF1648 domain-containing protein [Feifaniaceae bacterium]|nr:DUF1648 domain-containing protein [Feifaniaceae bacterium]